MPDTGLQVRIRMLDLSYYKPYFFSNFARRYVRAGNCDMARHDATEGENWLTPMLMGKWSLFIKSLLILGVDIYSC
jgi:hypothetical protein